MSGALDDRVFETSTTTGTGNFTLAGAATGYISFNTAFGVGKMFWYVIIAVDGSGNPTGDWEAGRGYLSGSTTLVRALVDRSTNSDAAVSFAAGTKNVLCVDSGHFLQNVQTGFNLKYGMP